MHTSYTHWFYTTISRDGKMSILVNFQIPHEFWDYHIKFWKINPTFLYSKKKLGK